MRFVACYANAPRAEAAIARAQAHAAKWEAEIDVVWAISREVAFSHDRLKRREDELEAHVTELFKDCEIPYKVHLLVDTAEPGEQIVHFAQRKKADMIFLGIRKQSRVGKILFGSNSRHIILNAPCPVFSVRRDMNGI